MISGCINNWIGIDNIREIDMSDQQREAYFDKICSKLCTDIASQEHFNAFLQFILEEFGEYKCSNKPCDQCGDYTETYKLEL